MPMNVRTTTRLRWILAMVTTVFFTVGSLAGETYYRWFDDRGNPVHSDRPPEGGTDYEVISTKSKLKRVVSGDEGAVPAEITPSAGNQFEQANSIEKPKLPSSHCRCALWVWASGKSSFTRR